LAAARRLAAAFLRAARCFACRTRRRSAAAAARRSAVSAASWAAVGAWLTDSDTPRLSIGAGADELLPVSTTIAVVVIRMVAAALIANTREDHPRTGLERRPR